MQTKLELLIIIINYRTDQLVIDCLKTVLPELNDARAAVVVDNNSADGSAERIQTWLRVQSSKHIDFIQSPTNTGFSGGNNIGIKHKPAKYYLLLNSDTLLRPDAIDLLIRTADSDNRIGITSPRLEWPNGEPQISCFRYHTPISEFINTAATRLITQCLEKWNVPIPVSETITYPQWTSFACVLIRSQSIHEMMLMDEDYFMYYEDVDLCRELNKNGWKIVNNPAARIVHLRGGSSSVKSDFAKRSRLPRYYYESRSRYYAKQFSHAGLFLANLAWHLGRAISWLRSMLGKDITFCEKQHIDIWTCFLNPLQTRKRKPNEPV